ncbi:transposase family protein [Wolbachia endosymbiont of Nasonia giraulti]|uniref:transposase family protein n=1 Tax=Wolbachia endosymbiont of Nasonia giraulti TaxID=180838 RepID=UPI003A8858FB
MILNIRDEENNLEILKDYMYTERMKKSPLIKEKKVENRELASKRVVVENVIGLLKRFKIIADRYRNRRKRFGLRFNFIAGIHNFELSI